MAKPARTTGSRSTGSHVALEVPSHHQHHRPHRSGLSDVSAFVEDHPEKGHFRLCYYRFFLWACLGLFIIIIILLIAGGFYVGILKSGKPYVNVMKLSITNLNADNNSQSMHKADISLEVRVSNKNHWFKLVYGPLIVDVTSKDVQLGRTKVGRFSQKPNNDTDLSVTMTLENIDRVNNTHAGNETKSELINVSEMVLDVYLSGKIGLNAGGILKVILVPILSSCRQIKQLDVGKGSMPECEVKLFDFRPSKN